MSFSRLPRLAILRAVLFLLVSLLSPLAASAAMIGFWITGGDSTITPDGFQSIGFTIHGHGITGTGTIDTGRVTYSESSGGRAFFQLAAGTMTLDLTDGSESWRLDVGIDTDGFIGTSQHDASGTLRIREIRPPDSLADALLLKRSLWSADIVLWGRVQPSDGLPRDWEHGDSTYKGSRLWLRATRTVPEPTTLALLAISAATLLRRRTYMRAAILVGAMALTTAATTAAQSVALRLARTPNAIQSANSVVILTLESGTQITIPASDFDAPATKQLLATVSPRTATPPPSAPPPQPSDPETVLLRHCTAQWPDNFRMRAFCNEQQRAALSSLARRSMFGSDEQTIRAKCRADWPDNFRMRDFCEEQQLKALESLRR